MVARTLLAITFYVHCMSCLSVMSACWSWDSSLVQCLGYELNNLCNGVCFSRATRYYYILQNLQSGCGASPASCAVAHSAWRSCPGSKVAGARRLPYLHLSPGVENTWTSGSTTAYAGNAYCCLTTRTAFPVLPILFPCFGLSYLSCFWLFLSCPSPPPPKKKIMHKHSCHTLF